MLSLALFNLCAALSLPKRESTFIGEGLGEVAIDAPGLAYPESYKGFPNAGEGIFELNFLSAFTRQIVTPGIVPPGVNPSQCTPKDGQYPIILVPGTLETPYTNWAYLGPKLAAEGYCVYSFAHNPLQFLSNATIISGTSFVGDIPQNAEALSTIVDTVLSKTGASKVDFVGHSQGAGAMPFYYLKNLMEGIKVRKMIGLAPSLGTTLYGVDVLFNNLLDKDEQNALSHLSDAELNAGALLQQLKGSDFLADLANGGYAVEGVEYVNIATKYDDVLLPYTNCLFEQDNRTITNIVLQDVCALDLSDHLGLAYSNVVHQIVLNHLKDEDNFVFCDLQLPVFNK